MLSRRLAGSSANAAMTWLIKWSRTTWVTGAPKRAEMVEISSWLIMWRVGAELFEAVPVSLCRGSPPPPHQ